MRKGGQAYNGLPTVVGNVITMKTYDGRNFSVASPLLVRMASGATVEAAAAMAAVDVTSSTFGFPDDFQGHSPLFVGIAKDGTNARLVVSADTTPVTTTNGAAITDAMGVQSAVAITQKEILWTHTVSGWKRVGGAWDFSTAVIGDSI